MADVFINKLIQFIIQTTKKYNIDDSHGISHSFSILHNTYNILKSEIKKHPYIGMQLKVILVSALLHDMCDKKYVDEVDGITKIVNFLSQGEIQISVEEIEAIKNIIASMSYSKVKENGFPDLGEYQLAFHIVREADLLCAYDVDRCIIFYLHNRNMDIQNALQNAEQLFRERVYKHEDDGFITFDYSRQQIPELVEKSKTQFKNWKLICETSVIFS
jgi:hypothetical protein